MDFLFPIYYDRYSHRVFLRARTYTKNEHTDHRDNVASQFTDDALNRVWKAKGSDFCLNEPSPHPQVIAYLMRTLYTVQVDYFRSSQKFHNAEEPSVSEKFGNKEPPVADTSEESVVEYELAHLPKPLCDKVTQLSPQERCVLGLILRRYNRDEILEKLGMTEKVYEVVFCKIKKKLDIKTKAKGYEEL